MKIDLQRANECPEAASVKRLGGLCDHRGSDVRVGLGVPLTPSGWPRAEVPALWRWKTITAFRWQLREHINSFELRAALATLRWRARQRRFLWRRVLHLLDSAVVIGVLTKRRSANYTMGKLVRRANALELAAQLHVFYGFTRSTHNPVDRPSRRFDVKKKGVKTQRPRPRRW